MTSCRFREPACGLMWLLGLAFAPAGCSSSSSATGDAAVAQGSDAADSSADVARASDAGLSADGLDAAAASGDGRVGDAGNVGGDVITPTRDGGPDCGAALVCDDFEGYGDGTQPPAPWSVSKNVGSVTIDSTRARSGNRSVRITAPAATGYRSVMLRLTDGGLLPVTGGSVYGRMMFYLESAPTTEVHWTFIDGSGLVPGTNYHAVYRYGGQKPLPGVNGGPGGSQMMASYDTPDFYSNVGPGSDCYKHASGRAVAVGSWTCAEWQFDGASNTMRFWINGSEAPDLTVSGTGDGCTQQPSSYVWTAPSFQQLDVGWESYQADDARNLWLDDVAYGTVRIGCPMP